MDRRDRELFAERMKDTRICHNQHGKQTMDEVAKATGVSKSTIHDLENEDSTRNVGFQDIRKLAIHYGVSTDYLLCLSDVRSRDTDLQALCRYTGLSEEALNVLHYYASGNFLRAHFGEYNLLISALIRSKTFEEVLHSIDVANSWKQKEMMEGFKPDEEGDIPEKYTVDDLTNAQEILFSVGDIWVTWGEFAEYHAQKSAYLFQGLARQIAGIDEPEQNKDITKTKGFIEFMQEEAANGQRQED